MIVLLAGPQQLSAPDQAGAHQHRVLRRYLEQHDRPLGDGTRYDASMKAIDHFLDIRKGDAFGLTFFGNNVLHWVPLTGDPSAIRCAPPFMKPENVPPWMGGTMIGKALLACKEILTSREEGDRMIILVSDGESFDLSGGNDESVAQTLKEQHRGLCHSHLGTEIPRRRSSTSRGMTGGEVFPVDDPRRFGRCSSGSTPCARPNWRRPRPSYWTTSVRYAWPVSRCWPRRAVPSSA